ncbi:MAG: glycosyltransferase family 4 protein [Cyanobacteria bacterium J06643_5]
MNPLLLSTFDINGGAAKAAFRLHNGLKDININSRMLVEYKTSSDPNIFANINKLEKFLNQMRPTLDNLPLKFYPKHDYGTFSPQWFPDFINYRIKHLSPDVIPDIINIHWTCGYLKIESIAKFKQPLVWTLHDMWAFTGGCHYSLSCNRYTESCGNCIQLESQKERDLSRWVWKRKAKAWQNLNLTIVTPSYWLAKVAGESSLFKNYPIKVIPNGIDIQKYKPIDRKTARKWLNLPVDKKLILSGAAKSSSKRKGIHFLEKALQNLSSYNNQVEIITFGSLQPSEKNSEKYKSDFKYHYMGYLHDDISLALIYAAADVFVTASIQDNLPNTVMEALASGTPCVAFNIGGISDMIEHQANGYLAQPFEVESLARGINWILSNNDPQKICDRARKKVEQEFSLELQARRYSQLFHEIINQKCL